MASVPPNVLASMSGPTSTLASFAIANDETQAEAPELVATVEYPESAVVDATPS
jgi:hypothetical protein